MIDLVKITDVREALQLAPTPVLYLQLLVFRENAKKTHKFTSNQCNYMQSFTKILLKFPKEK